MIPNPDLIIAANLLPMDEKCEFKPSTIYLTSVCDVPSIGKQVTRGDDFLDVISFIVFPSAL
jgi:hypothetical protein